MIETPPSHYQAVTDTDSIYKVYLSLSQSFEKPVVFVHTTDQDQTAHFLLSDLWSILST